MPLPWRSRAPCRAVKLVYLTTQAGIHLGPELLRQLTVEEAEEILKKRRDELAPSAVSKLNYAMRAARGGVPRVHIIDGRVEEGLLAEVFSNEGIGTLVHANEYQALRRAQKKDGRAIYNLIQSGIENDELLKRTRSEIERQIEDYYVFEIDRNPVGCVALHRYPERKQAEMACVCVDPKHENQGVGAKLMQYAEAQAREDGITQMFCLSTQAVNYFVQKGGYQLATPEALPPSRRERYERSGRRSQVLTKLL